MDRLVQVEMTMSELKALLAHLEDVRMHYDPLGHAKLRLIQAREEAARE